MSSFITGIILYICIVPTTLIMYFLLYPRNWRSKKRIYGVNNRAEFKTEKSAGYIDSLVAGHNRQAGVITIGVIIVATALLFLPGLNAKTISMTLLVFIALLAISVPYALGNSQLKKYKKVLGIVSENVLYADLKAARGVHALNKAALYGADIAGIALFILALLCDLGFLPVNLGVYTGSFLCTVLVGSFAVTNLILLPIAIIVDNSRNEVISENSDINANYNRSKKKIYADYFITLSWIDNAFALCLMLSLIFMRQEIATIIILAVFLVAIMAITALFAKKSIAHSRRYVSEETDLVEDDDDYWILGMFYYNPKDKHLNISKRAGIGTTVNIAHPAGKVITGIGILAIIAALMTLVWIGMMGSTPIKVTGEGDKIVCHHLWDEYTIPKSDIISTEYGDISQLTTLRTVGTGMENVRKGTYVVNGQSGCELFLNPRAGKYIKIVTSGKTYYISSDTEAETTRLYETIKE